MLFKISVTETNNPKTFLKLDVGPFKLQALTAFVEEVQLQNITGTHFQSLTNNILEFWIFGDNCWPISIAECIFAVVHHWRVVVRDSVGGAVFFANFYKIKLCT